MSGLEIAGLTIAGGEILLKLLPSIRKAFRHKRSVRALTSLCEEKILHLQKVISSLSPDHRIPEEAGEVLHEIGCLQNELVAIYHKNPLKRFWFILEREDELEAILRRLSHLLDYFKLANVIMWGINRRIDRFEEIFEHRMQQFSSVNADMHVSYSYYREFCSNGFSMSLNGMGSFPHADSRLRPFMPTTSEMDLVKRHFGGGYRFDDVCFWMGNRLQHGVGVCQNISQSFRFYEYAWALGNSKAALNLGWSYATGTGVEKDFRMAVSYYRKSATRHNSKAMINLSTLLTHGIGVNKDLNEALHLLNEVSKTNHEYAEFAKAQIYLRHMSGRENEKIGFYMLKKLKRSEDSSVLNELGVCYSQGRGTRPNKAKSFSMFAQAASKKDFWGTLNLSIAYLHGYGVTKDLKHANYLISKSREYYKRSFIDFDMLSRVDAKWGSDGIAYMYEHGIGVETDMKKALKYYEIAAENGNAEGLDHIHRNNFQERISSFSPVLDDSCLKQSQNQKKNYSNPTDEFSNENEKLSTKKHLNDPFTNNNLRISAEHRVESVGSFFL